MPKFKVFTKVAIALITIIQLCISTSLAGASKLDTIVLATVNLDSSPLDTSAWENEGFEKANATQISKNLGKTEVINK